MMSKKKNFSKLYFEKKRHGDGALKQETQSQVYSKRPLCGKPFVIKKRSMDWRKIKLDGKKIFFFLLTNMFFCNNICLVSDCI